MKLPRVVPSDSGPALLCSDGVTIHILTKVELLYLRLGFTSIKLLDAKYDTTPTQG
jgi:hypothetical protein